MDEIFKFVAEYWKVILSIILFILAFVLALVRKKPNKIIDTVAQSIYAFLPMLIREAEEKFGAGTGQTKLNYVISALRGWFAINDIGPMTEYYETLARKQIEEILNTPEKK